MTIRSTWRTLPVAVRVDDRYVNWMAFSPLIAAAAWAVALSSALVLGPLEFALLMLLIGTLLALADRHRLAHRFNRLPSVLWCFATPPVYLLLRKRALDRQGVGDSLVPLAIYAGCVGLLVAVSVVWVVLRALTFGL